ncbi:MAG: hypothetical protein COB42_05615 [Sulfurimonas sp.]|nr:MAG: hypothetical protein COB42_05615 [Sulfurimonas sp.]
MIFAYFSERNEFSAQQAYFKSDKNTRELTALFNHLKKRKLNINPRRINDTEYGVYYYDTLSYKQTEEEYLKLFNYDFLILTRDEFFDKCKELHISITPTNENDIREATVNYLKNKYKIHFIQDEYTHFSLPVRADLFAVSKDKKVITVEIKSDRDTFTRLRKQLEEYAKFSHIVYLAIDIKHLAKFLKNYPNYYGGILFYEDGKLEVYQTCYNKKYIDATNILWKQELLQFTTYFNGSFLKYSIGELEKIIINIFTVAEYFAISEYLFINRYLGEPIDFKHLINDLKYKQKQINKLGKKEIKNV